MAERYRMGRLVDGKLVHAFDLALTSKGSADIENEDESHAPDVQERARIRLVLARPIKAWGEAPAAKDGMIVDAFEDYAPGTPEHLDWAAGRLKPFYRIPEGRVA
jgi:hypothetical protein